MAEFKWHPESAKNLLLGQKRKKGRPLNNTATLIMQPSEAYSQAASSTARKSNSSSSTEPSLVSPKHKKHKKNEKSSKSLNPPHCPNCGEKRLRKKVFIVKINEIRNNF